MSMIILSRFNVSVYSRRDFDFANAKTKKSKVKECKQRKVKHA